ncbi:MAG TPA: C39 family peptidase [Rhodanobacteraceae bacterium]|nr:C39 family peptidase [Rhodanobacteraceae bacterium]
MTHFRLLKRTRQTTEYSCGASALQSVLAYWGNDVDEDELMRLMGTTEEEGTYPEKIAQAARALGFEAEVKQGLSLDEVQALTADGDPMIALAQVWRGSQSGKLGEDFNAGHYISVLGVDADNVYFQDPYVRNCKAFVPRGMFEASWQHVMGNDRKRNPKLEHLGIVIRGKQRAATNLAEEVKLASLDFAKFGSINLLVAKFSGNVFPIDVLEDVKRLLDPKSVRPDAFLFVRKGPDGKVAGVEGSGLEDAADVAEFNAIITAVTSRIIEHRPAASTAAAIKAAAQAAAEGDFGLSAEALQAVADKLQPNESALVVFFENLWERKFKEIAGKYGGEIVSQRMVTPRALAEAAQRLVAAAGQERRA